MGRCSPLLVKCQAADCYKICMALTLIRSLSIQCTRRTVPCAVSRQHACKRVLSREAESGRLAHLS